jgi:hypothetical protein
LIDVSSTDTKNDGNSRSFKIGIDDEDDDVFSLTASNTRVIRTLSSNKASQKIKTAGHFDSLKRREGSNWNFDEKKRRLKRDEYDALKKGFFDSEDQQSIQSTTLNVESDKESRKKRKKLYFDQNLNTSKSQTDLF